MKNKYSEVHSPLQEDVEKKRRRIWVILLVLLLLLTLFSSVIVGFLIGRITDTYRGQMIDTIVIGPEESRLVHVSGQVLYTNGTPYPQGNVELYSEPRLTTTDDLGHFFYASVEPGSHTLSIVDDSGKALAQCEFLVSQNHGEEPVHIQKQDDGAYAVELSVNVRFVELAVELDMDGSTLSLIPEKTVVLEDDGTLTKNGKVLNVGDGVIVLPSGTVILTDKTVVTNNQLILPDNSVAPISKDGYTSENGEHVDENGAVSLSDGTIISSGSVKRPGGEPIIPDEPYQILPDHLGESTSPQESTAANAGRPSQPSENSGSQSRPPSEAGRPSQPPTDTPEHEEPPAETGGSEEPPAETTESEEPPAETTESEAPPAETTESEAPPAETGESETAPADTSKPDDPPSETDTNETTEETVDHGRVDVQGQNAAGWENWESQSVIDLFYNRTGISQNDTIQPGSEGYYLFRVDNSRLEPLDLTLTLSEKDLHLPLEFTLTPLDADGDKRTGQEVTGVLSDGALELKSMIQAEEQITYRLDWVWPYEGRNAMDTIAGINGGTYTLELHIHAQARENSE